jgi:hypothetical protein
VPACGRVGAQQKIHTEVRKGDEGLKGFRIYDLSGFRVDLLYAVTPIRRHADTPSQPLFGDFSNQIEHRLVDITANIQIFELRKVLLIL